MKKIERQRGFISLIIYSVCCLVAMIGFTWNSGNQQSEIVFEDVVVAQTNILPGRLIAIFGIDHASTTRISVALGKTLGFNASAVYSHFVQRQHFRLVHPNGKIEIQQFVWDGVQQSNVPTITKVIPPQDCTYPIPLPKVQQKPTHPVEAMKLCQEIGFEMMGEFSSSTFVDIQSHIRWYRKKAVLASAIVVVPEPDVSSNNTSEAYKLLRLTSRGKMSYGKIPEIIEVGQRSVRPSDTNFWKFLASQLRLPSDLTADSVQHPTVDSSRPNPSFDVARASSLTPLRPVDRDLYTIRMNTYKRHDQLIASIDYHSKCEGVAEIQVIWYEEEDPPRQVLENPKVVIEKHEINKLNQRFNILIPTPTLGVLSVDDDVLRPCEAIDMAFHAWTKNPERQVGFDRRRHRVMDDGRWEVNFKKQIGLL